MRAPDWLTARPVAHRGLHDISRGIVENMPGANGGLAGGNVARSPSDGYTLMLAVDSNLVINPSLYAKIPYDPIKDFTAVSLMCSSPHVIAVNPGNPTQIFEGSDGGLIRTSGDFADISSQCDSPHRNGGGPLLYSFE